MGFVPPKKISLGDPVCNEALAHCGRESFKSEYRKANCRCLADKNQNSLSKPLSLTSKILAT